MAFTRLRFEQNKQTVSGCVSAKKTISEKIRPVNNKHEHNSPSQTFRCQRTPVVASLESPLGPPARDAQPPQTESGRLTFKGKLFLYIRRAGPCVRMHTLHPSIECTRIVDGGAGGEDAFRTESRYWVAGGWWW